MRLIATFASLILLAMPALSQEMADTVTAPVDTAAVSPEPKAPGTPIIGEHAVDALALTHFVQMRNPAFDPAIAEAFITVGQRYGLRGDIALCQAIVETGWFKFSGGTAVTPEMHNYCGLGVTQLGRTGCSFETIEDGVAAMLQHLWAYCTTLPLPEGETLLDPRFKLVSRGVAPCWEDLSGRWAANPAYGQNILSVYRQLLATCREVHVREVSIPDEMF